QTPKVPDGVPFGDLVARKDRSRPPFRRDEHPSLLTEGGVRTLLARAGAPHVVFHPAIFWFYDQFFAASRLPLVEVTDPEVAARFTSPSQRTVLALVDLFT